ncbi:MAG: MFS transporter, partial [Muribaculaceae bacterium]|nr:MFS transporter [Muribaculaceae bacterium]
IFFFATNQIARVILMMLGTAILFGSGSPLQSSIVGYSRGGEFLGAACIQIAYNAGNAMAASLGSSIISAGYGIRYTSLVGIPFILTGCILLFLLYARFERRSEE